MKVVATQFLFLLFLTAYAQPPQQSVLDVSGKGELSVSPDIGILRLTLKEKAPDVNGAISKLNEKTEEVTKQLLKLGYDKDEIFTTNFNVNVNRVYERGTSREDGYIATQQLKLEFPNDQKNIKGILNAFASGTENLELNFGFKLSTERSEETKQKLIELATLDARKKAAHIAKVAGVQLVRIAHINYGSGPSFNPQYQYTERATMATARMDKQQVNGFTPEDQTYRTSISISWIIRE